MHFLDMCPLSSMHPRESALRVGYEPMLLRTRTLTLRLGVNAGV